MGPRPAELSPETSEQTISAKCFTTKDNDVNYQTPNQSMFNELLCVFPIQQGFYQTDDFFPFARYDAQCDKLVRQRYFTSMHLITVTCNSTGCFKHYLSRTLSV